MATTLEQSREAARAEIERLDRLIEIKEFIVSKLTNEDGSVIDAKLDFEYGGMQVSIRKARARNQVTTPHQGSKGKRSSTRKPKAEPKELTKSMVDAIGALKFSGLKKKEAVAYIKSEVSKFTDAHWDSFKTQFNESLEREGTGAGTQWSLN